MAKECDPDRRSRWFCGGSTGQRAGDDDGQDGCVLELAHSGLDDREMIVGVLAGWHAHLDLLSEVLEGGRTTDFWVRDQQLEGEYRARV